MWDLPRPGLEPVSPAPAGGLPTTVPPGKSLPISSDSSCPVCHSRREQPKDPARTELLTNEGAACMHSFLQSSASTTRGMRLCISELSPAPHASPFIDTTASPHISRINAVEGTTECLFPALSFNSYSLNTYYVPCIVLGPGHTVKNTCRIPALPKLISDGKRKSSRWATDRGVNLLRGQ